MVEQGYRAVMLYLVQRDDCTRFALAADIDAEYAVEMAAAREMSVEALCFATKPTPMGVNLVEELPIYK
jgi:sugar fermentation stimulation protein A